MKRDIYNDHNVVRYRVSCQQCDEIFLVYELLAPVPEQILISDKGPSKTCPGSGKPGNLVSIIPAR